MPAETNEPWLADAVAALDLVGEAGATHRLRLEQELGEEPVVVLVGAFNTGKSSLLKRLCTDSGVPVPPQLVIDAKPATAVTYDVVINGVRWRDTPGLDSASLEHGGIAAAAAAYADVVVLTLTHELFSADDELGSFVAGLAAVDTLPAGVMQAVITRGDDQAGARGGERFTIWADQKAQEAADRLDAAGLRGVAVHVAVADVRGRNADADVTPESYEATRSWDRVAATHDAIHRAATATGLRDAAIRRATIYALEQAAVRVRRDLRALDTAGAEDIAAATDARRILERLKDFERGSRDELRETLRLAAASGSAASITPRFQAAYEMWSAKAAREIEDLAEDAGLSIDPWRWQADFAVEDLSVQANGRSEIPDQVGPMLEEELRKRAERLAGSKDEAAKLGNDLKAWEEAKRKNQVRKHYEGKEGFGSLRDKREAEARLRDLRRRQQAFAVFEAGASIAQREREDEARRQADTDARELERELAETQAVLLARKLFDGAEVIGWKQHIVDVRVEVEARIAELEASDARVSLEHALDRLAAARDSLMR